MDGIHPLVRMLYLLHVEVSFLRERAGFEKWQPPHDVNDHIEDWALVSGFSWCCGAKVRANGNRLLPRLYCSQCERHLNPSPDPPPR